jgi:hypothetical protein
MRVLYIATDREDFQSDCVLHGLSSLPGIDVVDWPSIDYMHQLIDGMPADSWQCRGQIDDSEVDRTYIKEKVQDHFFDCVVYGSIHRSHLLWDEVIKVYKPTEVLAIDGEDNPRIGQTSVDAGFWDSYALVHGHGLYFKRELATDPKYLYALVAQKISTEFDNSDVFPINFAFPEEKFCRMSQNKTKDFGQTIPGQMGTYKFLKEEDYFKDYQESFFGLTWKKSGWWCMRHLEILANQCIPLWVGLPNLEDCPPKMLFRFPKELCIQATKLEGVRIELLLIDDRPEKNVLSATIDHSVFNYRQYTDLLAELVMYSLNNLTTVELAKYLLDHYE